MISLRALLHVLLALALVAGGLLPESAAAAPHAHDDVAQATPPDPSPPCHAPSPAPEATPAMDCCDGGGSDCGCDCLHHAPVAVQVEVRGVGLRHRWVAELGQASPLFSIAVAPAIRPPIA